MIRQPTFALRIGLARYVIAMGTALILPLLSFTLYVLVAA